MSYIYIYIYMITHNDATQSVGLLWTSDQLVAETSTRQHTTLTTDKYPSPRWDSNPRSQQVNFFIKIKENLQNKCKRICSFDETLHLYGPVAAFIPLVVCFYVEFQWHV